MCIIYPSMDCHSMKFKIHNPQVAMFIIFNKCFKLNLYHSYGYDM